MLQTESLWTIVTGRAVGEHRFINTLEFVKLCKNYVKVTHIRPAEAVSSRLNKITEKLQPLLEHVALFQVLLVIQSLSTDCIPSNLVPLNRILFNRFLFNRIVVVGLVHRLLPVRLLVRHSRIVVLAVQRLAQRQVMLGDRRVDYLYNLFGCFFTGRRQIDELDETVRQVIENMHRLRAWPHSVHLHRFVQQWADVAGHQVYRDILEIFKMFVGCRGSERSVQMIVHLHEATLDVLVRTVLVGDPVFVLWISLKTVVRLGAMLIGAQEPWLYVTVFDSINFGCMRHLGKGHSAGKKVNILGERKF